MTRLEILTYLAKKTNAKYYLEIGVDKGDIINNLRIENKFGIDPDKNSAANIITTSDIFFSVNKQTFDLIFIDGLHHADQVEKDINNALSILNENGYIVCHDMLPSTVEMQTVPRVQSEWTGDCWKAWVKLRQLRNDIIMYVVDTDYGCGIITQGRQDLLTVNCELNYDNFCKYKQEWMKIISMDEFYSQI